MADSLGMSALCQKPTFAVQQTVLYSITCQHPPLAERALRNILPHPRGSVRLDARELDHLRPFLGFVGDELAEVGGRAWKCGGAPLGKPRLHLGIGKGRVDLRVELVASASTLGVLCWKSSRENIVSTANFLGR